MHTPGAYSVQPYLTSKLIFDLRAGRRIFAPPDVGWVTGHSYVIYGIQNGVTTVMYEGAPDYPSRITCGKSSMTIKSPFSTPLQPQSAPASSRAYGIRNGTRWPALRLLGTVGEPINPEAWIWYREIIGKGQCPHRRHLVADGNRRHHAGAAARSCSTSRVRPHVLFPVSNQPSSIARAKPFRRAAADCW